MPRTASFLSSNFKPNTAERSEVALFIMTAIVIFSPAFISERPGKNLTSAVGAVVFVNAGSGLSEVCCKGSGTGFGKTLSVELFELSEVGVGSTVLTSVELIGRIFAVSVPSFVVLAVVVLTVGVVCVFELVSV